MEEKKKHTSELDAIAPLVNGIGNANPYTVPDDYFNSLTGSILFHVQLSQLKNITNSFSVPESYFENLANDVLVKIHNSGTANEVQQELSEIAPLLNTIDKKNIFSLPHNYFEKHEIPVPRGKTGKIISIAGNIRKWVTYAAAASVLFIIATTTYLYVTIHNRSIEKHMPVEQKIAELNEEEIINYLKDNDGIMSGSLIPATNEDPQILHMLQRVSDEEIENYLNEYGDQNEKPIKGI